MPGRRRLPGTDAQRAAARRQQVRENVRAYRRRNRERQLTGSGNESSGSALRPQWSRTSSMGSETPGLGNEDFQIQTAGQQVELACETIDGGVGWFMRLPLKISMGPADTNAFISASQAGGQPGSPPLASFAVQILSTPPNSSSSTIANDQSVTSAVPGLPPATIHVKICCAEWVTEVTFLSTAPGSDMIKEALLAAALSLVSIEQRDERMRIQATQIHTAALRKLREGFDDYVNGIGLEKVDLLAATACTCSMTELLINKSWEGFSLHLRGAGALIEQKGVDGLSSETTRANYYSYRTVQLPFLILERRTNFLCKPDWIHASWGNVQLHATDPVQVLMDVAFQLPTQIELYDNAQTRTAPSLRQQLHTLDQIALGLVAWRQSHGKENYSVTSFEPQPSFWHGHLPPSSTPLIFHNDHEANTFLSFTGIQIALLTLRHQITQSLRELDATSPPASSSEVLTWSRLACRCLESSHNASATGILDLAALFAFDQAWLAFLEMQATEGSRVVEDLQWCERMVEHMEGTGFPVLKCRT